MRIIRFFFSTIFVTLLVVGGAYAWTNRKNLGSLFPKNTPALNFNKTTIADSISPSPESNETVGSVLGATQGKLDSIGKIVGKSLDDSVSQLESRFMTEDQKIQIDQAVQQVQQQAVHIPQDVYERARFEYCKQVVDEYK